MTNQTFPRRFRLCALVLVTALLISGSAFAAGLSKGSKGEEVRRLQQRLHDLGYDPGTVDGAFGNATAAALMCFQGRNGLDMDGAAGADTLTLLYSDGAKGPGGTDEPKPYVTEDGMPLLVNLDHPFPDNYVYHDLVVMNNYCDKALIKIKYKGTLAEREAVDALIEMLSAAKAQGIGNWQISAACRTVQEQQRLMDNRVSTNMKNGMSRRKAESAARQTVALPGCSEHHLGTCFDITVPGKTFAGTKQHKWLLEHCWDFGFILRYTKEKADITGFIAEAWHYRYVGVEHAKAMQAQNLCLEEYVEMYGGH